MEIGVLVVFVCVCVCVCVCVILAVLVRFVGRDLLCSVLLLYQQTESFGYKQLGNRGIRGRQLVLKLEEKKKKKKKSALSSG